MLLFQIQKVVCQSVAAKQQPCGTLKINEQVVKESFVDCSPSKMPQDGYLNICSEPERDILYFKIFSKITDYQGLFLVNLESISYQKQFWLQYHRVVIQTTNIYQLSTYSVSHFSILLLNTYYIKLMLIILPVDKKGDSIKITE